MYTHDKDGLSRTHPDASNRKEQTRAALFAMSYLGVLSDSWKHLRWTNEDDAATSQCQYQ